MTRYIAALALTMAVAAAGAVRAQQPPAPAAPPPAAPTREGALLKVQVVISRYQGEKRISSQPYTLSVSANGPRATLRTGVQVPVPSGPVAATDGKAPPIMAFNYKNVGTSIDCIARPLDDGRYRLELSIDDSSLAADDQNPSFVRGMPQFRSLQISGETALLRDGQTTQLMTAADKVSGEVAKVDVTLTVVK